MYSKIRLLIVEDDHVASKHLAQACQRQSYQVEVAATIAEAEKKLRDFSPDVMLLDLSLPDGDGMVFLENVKARNNSCEVVVNTASAEVERAVEAMRLGAFDYITKPLNLEAILFTLDRVAVQKRLKKENRFLREQYESQFSQEHVGIYSSVLAEAFELASRFSPRELPVLVQGESGTGKELVARHIHARSSLGEDASGPFIPINCSALPLTLAESELFGYAGGSFTGSARGGSAGKLAAADGGSIFLDEIGELAPEIQGKLLRFLQERQFYPVGATRSVKVDVKVICATNRNLADEVAAGRFRKDLFFRINVGGINIPPLRERPREIIPLARQFLAEFSQAYNRTCPEINGEAEKLLVRQEWPGNIRELKNLCERLILVNEDATITARCLRQMGVCEESSDFQQCNNEADPVGGTSPAFPDMPPEGFDLEAHVDEIFRKALEYNRNNQSRTARYLGITREVLRHRMKRMGLL